MAVISGQVPSTDYVPQVRRRVVVKFRSSVQLPYTNQAETKVAEHVGKDWALLKSTFPGIRLQPYFSTLPRNNDKDAAMAAFAAYYGVDCPPGVEPQFVAQEMARWSIVEIAYVEGGPVAPPLDPGNDPLSASEAYLDAAPNGIDARYVWNTADGNGIGFVDMEQGWTLNHEDLAAANINIISGVNQSYPGHGTAVLGEVAAVDNTRGGIGIAPNATVRVVSQWRTATTYNTAEAILSAANAMSYGDVLLLEAQTNYQSYTFVPAAPSAATSLSWNFSVSSLFG